MTVLEKKDPTKTSTDHLALTPLLEGESRDFLNQKPELVDLLLSALGSPLNLVFPDRVRTNLENFERVFSGHGLRNRIFFAHKCNRSDALVKELALTKASIDVSSVEELKHALACGFAASRIQSTGPKNQDFLALSLLHNTVISVDSLQELHQIVALKEHLGTQEKTRILLRVCGFRGDHINFKTKASRFGTPVDRTEEALVQMESHSEQLEFLGFSYHVDTVSIAEKALALENCLELIELSYDYGFEPTVVNIGGGFKVNYLEKEEDWNRYTTALKEAVLGARPFLTWHNGSYGLSARNGTLTGSLNIYNFYDPSTGPDFLNELLNFKLVNLNNATIASTLRENGIELWIEPGRSLIAQCGLTVARVIGLKESSDGDTLVLLDMKRQDVSFIDQELFLDPIILSNHDTTSAPLAMPTPVYFAGNLCLESDLITKRQVFLERLPEPGDLAVFVNTAGYFMDFSASHSIMQPVAKKVAVYKEHDNFAWTLDEKYCAFKDKARQS